MGLFGSKEDRVTLKKEIQEGMYEKERELIDSLKGKYYSKMFSTNEFAKSKATATEKLYGEIADFANYFNLEIKSISRLDDNSLNVLGITVMFERN